MNITIPHDSVLFFKNLINIQRQIFCNYVITAVLVHSGVWYMQTEWCTEGLRCRTFVIIRWTRGRFLFLIQKKSCTQKLNVLSCMVLCITGSLTHFSIVSQSVNMNSFAVVNIQTCCLLNLAWAGLLARHMPSLQQNWGHSSSIQ